MFQYEDLCFPFHLLQLFFYVRTFIYLNMTLYCICMFCNKKNYVNKYWSRSCFRLNSVSVYFNIYSNCTERKRCVAEMLGLTSMVISLFFGILILLPVQSSERIVLTAAKSQEITTLREGRDSKKTNTVLDSTEHVALKR